MRGARLDGDCAFVPALIVAVGLAAAPASGCGSPSASTPEAVDIPAPSGSAPDEEARAPVRPHVEAPRPPEDYDACLADLREAKPMGAEPAFADYRQALASEQQGNLDAARRSQLKVIQDFPSSRIIPLSYLAFGLFFAKEAPRDPSKWTFAEQSFQEVVKYPPPENVAYAVANVELGKVFAAEGRDDGALASFKRALEASAEFPELGCAEPARIAARTGLVQSYAKAGSPERAADFFRASFHDEWPGAVAELVHLYRTSGNDQGARAALVPALRASATPALCEEAVPLARGDADLQAAAAACPR